MGILNQKNNERPSGVTIIAIWYFFFALYNLISLFGISAGAIGLWSWAENYANTLELGALRTIVSLVVSLFYGCAYAIVSFGLWTLKSWGWGAGVILGILLLPAIPIGTFIGAVSLIYFLKSPKVKEAFRTKTK